MSRMAPVIWLDGALNGPTAISSIDAAHVRFEGMATGCACHSERFGTSHIWRHPASEALT